MADVNRPKTLVLLLALYALVTFGAFFEGSPESRIVGLLFLFVLLTGLLAGVVVRRRPLAMAMLLWMLAAVQTLFLIVMLAARVGDPGIVAFVNVGLIGGMVYGATLFGLAHRKARDTGLESQPGSTTH